jgi:purine catabolism regulator
MLLETLLAFFADGLDTGRTAERLHLHPNSLRYRLGRIETVLGRPLRDPATIAELQLLLVAGSPPSS